MDILDEKKVELTVREAQQLRDLLYKFEATPAAIQWGYTLGSRSVVALAGDDIHTEEPSA